jgi:hypothetical protein
MVDGLQLDVKGTVGIMDQARAYGKHRIVVGIRAGGFDVDGDVGFG